MRTKQAARMSHQLKNAIVSAVRTKNLTHKSREISIMLEVLLIFDVSSYVSSNGMVEQTKENGSKLGPKDDRKLKRNKECGHLSIGHPNIHLIISHTFSLAFSYLRSGCFVFFYLFSLRERE